MTICPDPIAGTHAGKKGYTTPSRKPTPAHVGQLVVQAAVAPEGGGVILPQLSSQREDARRVPAVRSGARPSSHHFPDLSHLPL